MDMKQKIKSVYRTLYEKRSFVFDDSECVDIAVKVFGMYPRCLQKISFDHIKTYSNHGMTFDYNEVSIVLGREMIQIFEEWALMNENNSAPAAVLRQKAEKGEYIKSDNVEMLSFITARYGNAKNYAGMNITTVFVESYYRNTQLFFSMFEDSKVNVEGCILFAHSVGLLKNLYERNKSVQKSFNTYEKLLTAVASLEIIAPNTNVPDISIEDQMAIAAALNDDVEDRPFRIRRLNQSANTQPTVPTVYRNPQRNISTVTSASAMPANNDEPTVPRIVRRSDSPNASAAPRIIRRSDSPNASTGPRIIRRSDSPSAIMSASAAPRIIRRSDSPVETSTRTTVFRPRSRIIRSESPNERTVSPRSISPASVTATSFGKPNQRYTSSSEKMYTKSSAPTYEGEDEREEKSENVFRRINRNR